MRSLASDLASSLRRLRAAPAHAAGVVLAVALATAAAAVVYAVVDAVLLRPLPYPDPERLVWIWATRSDRDKAFFAVADFLDHRAAGHALTDVAAFTGWAGNLAGPAGRERLQGARVTPNAFELLGVRAALGRALQPADAEPGAERIVVLSHGLWQRRFGGSAAAVGATLVLNDDAFRVVGVLGPDFLFPGVPAELVGVLDLERDPRRADRGTNFLRAFGRLAPGATRAQVADEWATVSRELRARFPDTNAKKTEPRVITLAEEMLGEHRAALLALLGAVVAVALLAFANIATLQALRGLAREGELAVRRALGASRLDLVRLSALEAGTLVLAGSLLGLGLARLALGAVVALVPVTLPRAHAAAIDMRLTAAALLAAALTAAACVGLPLLAHRHAAPALVLRPGLRAGDPPGRQRARRALAVLQVSVAFVLLATAALFLATYHRLQDQGPGVRVAGLVQVRMSLPPRAYPDQASLEAYVARLRSAVASEPEVRTAAVASSLPLSGLNARSDFVILGREPRTAAEMPGAQLRHVSPGFTETLGLPVRRGRTLDEHDLESRSAVALVDETLARQFWGEADPVGESVRLETGTPGEPAFRVIGVVGDVKHFDLADAPLGTLYLPVHGLSPMRRGFFAGGFTLAVAGDVDGGPARQRIAGAIRRADPEASASAPASMSETLAQAQAARRFAGVVLAGFAATAALLAAAGLYSLVAATAQGQRREWGVRLALGASPRIVTFALLRGAAATLAWGLAAGAPLSLLVLGTLAPRLAPGLRAEPGTWLAIAALFTLATLLAVLGPARRAARLDVARILRE
jgi:putative ABC transport system permease protein